MIDANTGWALGGPQGAGNHVLRTADGGVTWADVTPPQPVLTDPTLTQSATAFFMDASLGWVAFYAGPLTVSSPAYVWSTRDGGASWQAAGLNEPALGAEYYLPSNLFFVDAKVGWMLAHVGAGMNHDYVVLLGTTDGGASWFTMIEPQGNDGGIQSCSKSQLAFATDQAGWLAVDCHGVAPTPYIFKTSDGGSTWMGVDLPEPEDAPGLFQKSYCGVMSEDMFSATAGAVLVVCTAYEDTTPKVKSYLYFTSDAGGNWQARAIPAGAMAFLDPQTVFALGRDISKSVDGGINWSPVKSVDWDGQFSFVDANLVWAVARNGDQLALVKSSNGGQTWQEIKPRIGP
jgi:photosystem II stability/assembly factor-like uncharacterized protein